MVFIDICFWIKHNNFEYAKYNMLINDNVKNTLQPTVSISLSDYTYFTLVTLLVICCYCKQ